MSLRRRSFLQLLGLVPIAPTLTSLVPASPSPKAQPTPKGGFYGEATYGYAPYNYAQVKLDKDIFLGKVTLGDCLYLTDNGKLTNDPSNRSYGFVGRMLECDEKTVTIVLNI